MLLYEITVAGRVDLYWETVRLVRAASEEDAVERAEAAGREGETEGVNGEGEAVVWRFLGLAEVKEIDLDEDGDGDLLDRSFTRLDRYMEIFGEDGRPFGELGERFSRQRDSTA
ncbi:DUF4288 domain-containing protein [Actinomadura parmotrematis]|uniref:DUF4288 domain-containing protein n=1 Tax=Actinomadura parmotrematis TaxID=2864039 RepID=A0ABS7FW86_9ACTN|nr:DUF4288 domain-containing protein [Actinomadura parmotrematis]MBW8484698.1 DUF4288 domain-containing protein [Actinomadura parmotrematis]